MKRIIFILLIIIILPAFSFAQSKKNLSNFWSIPWGTNIKQAEAIFQERGINSYVNDNLILAEAEYERERSLIMLVFNRANRLHSAHVIYTSCPNTALSKYEHYRSILFRRYGMSDTSVAYFEEPFARGDGREIEAIQSDNAFYFTEWNFEDGCVASLSILNNLEVCLTFKNPAMADS